jgi:hypothetical protein
MQAPPTRLRLLLCRVGIWHRWRTKSNEWGERWQICLACKKERDVPGGTIEA